MPAENTSCSGCVMETISLYLRSACTGQVVVDVAYILIDCPLQNGSVFD